MSQEEECSYKTGTLGRQSQWKSDTDYIRQDATQGKYFNSQTCAWSIKGEPNFNITLFVDTFQSEKQFDALEVFDGKPPLCVPQHPEYH